MNISLTEENVIKNWVRLAAEVLSNQRTDFVCNELNLPKRIPVEKKIYLMLQLIAREPRPFVEYLTSGCTQLRRAEIVGDGTKKSPYKAQWKNDYYVLVL